MSADPIGVRHGAASPLFDPLKIGGLEVRNRLVVAPMTRVSVLAKV